MDMFKAIFYLFLSAAFVASVVDGYRHARSSSGSNSGSDSSSGGGKQRSCPAPIPPPYGYIARGGGSLYKIGSFVKFLCHDGYELYGRNWIRCLRGGKWNRLPPVCKPIIVEGVLYSYL